MKIFFQKNVSAAMFAVIIAFCGGAAASSAQSLQARVDELIKTRKYNTGGLSVVFVDLAADSTVVSVNPDAMMNPASVQKLITGAAAFEILGPTYTFRTNVYIDGPFHADSGVVNGNLYIRGTGEPGLNAEKIWLLTQHLRHRGIKRVTGDLVIDNFFFDEVSLGPGFSEEESRSFQSLISALAPSYNSIAIHHRPGHAAGSPVHVDIFPKVDGFRINNTAKTINGRKGRLDVTTSFERGTTQINVRGTMGVEEPPAYTYRRMWQTWEAFGGAFRAQCKTAGITIQGKTVQRRVPDTLAAKDAFYSFGGEPLTEYIQHVFKWSSNFVSEMIFKTMGAAQRGEPGSWVKGTDAVLEWWESRELPGKPYIINGSGMGTDFSLRRRSGNRQAQSKNRRAQTAEEDADTTTELGASVTPGSGVPNTGRVENLVSAGQMAALLTYVSKQKNYYPDFVASLPVSGVDGTLRSRFQRSRLRGAVRGKTGTLNSLKVSSLAGYLLLEDKTYAFAIFCNNVGPSQYDNWIMQEQILETIARTNGGGW